MHTLSFLQFSDLHLDSLPGCARLRLPPAKAEQRRSELRQIVADLCGEARQRRVDLVLVPGNLFDDDAVSPETIQHTQECFAGLAPVPVFISPGTGDPYSPSSPYDTDFLTSIGLEAWPDNVHLFTEPGWSRVALPGNDAVEVVGRAYTAGQSLDTRPLADPLPAPGAPVRLLLVHGTLEGHAAPGGAVVQPFAEAELRAQQATYAALGLLPTRTLVRAAEAEGREDVSIVAAYSGCPAGRNLDETGEKAGLHVLMEAGEGSSRVHASPVRVDRRTVHDLEVVCDGTSNEGGPQGRIEEALRVAECQPEDIVHVRLRGHYLPEPEALPPGDFLRDRFFHVSIDATALRPQYDLVKLLDEHTRSTEARYARQLDAALTSESDPERRGMLERALYYGLDALVRNEVMPRYED